MKSSFDFPAALRSRQWWAGMTLGVISTVVVAALVFFTVPYLLVFVLAWPLLLTLATLTLDRRDFTAGAFASLFVVLLTVVATLLVCLI